jgi:hypothetical protein
MRLRWRSAWPDAAALAGCAGAGAAAPPHRCCACQLLYHGACAVPFSPTVQPVQAETIASCVLGARLLALTNFWQLATGSRLSCTTNAPRSIAILGASARHNSAGGRQPGRLLRQPLARPGGWHGCLV